MLTRKEKCNRRKFLVFLVLAVFFLGSTFYCLQEANRGESNARTISINRLCPYTEQEVWPYFPRPMCGKIGKRNLMESNGGGFDGGEANMFWGRS